MNDNIYNLAIKLAKAINDKLTNKNPFEQSFDVNLQLKSSGDYEREALNNLLSIIHNYLKK